MTPGIKSLVFICLPLIFLQACSSSQPTTRAQQDTPPAVDSQPLSADKPPVQPQTFMLRGQLVLSGDSQTITPCGSRHQFITRFRQHDLRQAASVVPHPNQAVYAELIGHLEVPDSSGQEGDFPARFRVASISMIDPQARTGCQQDAHATRAFGHSPDWSVHFRENRLIYRTNHTEQSSPLQSTRLEQHQRHYQIEKGKLRLQRKICRPDTGSALYGWQSAFSLADKTYRGCATLANLDPTQSWSGLYQATSTRSRDFSVRMQLNPDHTATTSYHYQNRDEASRESGFWQQVDRHRIQVVMTRYQGQRLIAERVFNGDRYRLTATTETVSGTTYPIKDGGLTLFRSQADQQQPARSGIAPQTRVLKTQTLKSSAKRQSDVEQALRRYFQLHRTPVDDTRYRWLKFDLNRDGKEELLALTSWCEEKGCTMLVFEQRGEQWRFNSRISGVQTPFYLGTQQRAGWQELILPQGRNTQPKALPYNGVSYPARAEDGEAISSRRISKITLFRDGLSPQTDGVKL